MHVYLSTIVDRYKIKDVQDVNSHQITKWLGGPSFKSFTASKSQPSHPYMMHHTR